METMIWVPKEIRGATRYYRDDGTGYNMRHMMEPAAQGKPRRRKWALYHKEMRVWDVQPHDMLSEAIKAAEDWIKG
jgi:hypothetical protein